MATNEKRINLCFNLDDPPQKAVASYLDKMGKKKTATVVKAVALMVVNQSKEEKAQFERDEKMSQALSALSRKSDNKQELARIEGLLNEIINRLDAGVVTVGDGSKVQDKPQEQKKDDSGEMSEEAFSAMLTMFG